MVDSIQGLSVSADLVEFLQSYYLFRYLCILAGFDLLLYVHVDNERYHE